MVDWVKTDPSSADNEREARRRRNRIRAGYPSSAPPRSTPRPLDDVELERRAEASRHIRAIIDRQAAAGW